MTTMGEMRDLTKQAVASGEKDQVDYSLSRFWELVEQKGIFKKLVGRLNKAEAEAISHETGR